MTYYIQGIVKLDGEEVEGAVVTAIYEDNGTKIIQTTTGIDGTYLFNNVLNVEHHIKVEYENGENKYHSLSYPFVMPVEV